MSNVSTQRASQGNLNRFHNQLSENGTEEIKEAIDGVARSPTWQMDPIEEQTLDNRVVNSFVDLNNT